MLPAPQLRQRPTADVPEEFGPACDKPVTEVVTERLDVTIKHSDCDLTGVTIVGRGRGAVVQNRASALVVVAA